MPTTRQVFVPQPVVGRSDGRAARLHRRRGPGQRRAVHAARRRRADQAARRRGPRRPVLRPLGARACSTPDTEENLQQLFVAERWTDFLPIVLPTEERVEAMLAGTSRARDEVVGRLRPTAFREFWEFTVEKVAVNAVMAGARPEYLPVILRRAGQRDDGRSSSTTSFATIAMVNGPIRNEIGMNSGIGTFGPTTTPTRRSAARTAWARPTCRADRSPVRPTWARRATPTPTAPPSPRTRSAARGRRSTSSTASSRPTAR